MINPRWTVGQRKVRDSRYDRVYSEIVEVFGTEITLLQDIFCGYATF